MFPQSSKTTCFQHFSDIFRKKERLLILLSQGWSCLWHGRRLPAQRNILGIGSTFREMRCKLRSMPLSGNLDSGPVWKGGIRSQKGHRHGKSWRTHQIWGWLCYFLSFIRFSDLQLVVWSSKLKLKRSSGGKEASRCPNQGCIFKDEGCAAECGANEKKCCLALPGAPSHGWWIRRHALSKSLTEVLRECGN